MKPGTKKLTINQGSTFTTMLTWGTMSNDSWTPPMTQAEIEAAWTVVNLTGYTAAAQGRARVGDTATVWALTSSPAAGITLGGAAGTITLTLTAAQTALLTPGSGVWDLELTSPGGVVTRLVSGTYEITAEVTR